MIGLLCVDSIEIVGHSLFNNYRLALNNYLKVPLKEVRCIGDLDGIKILIIVDEHFGPVVDIWKNQSFIQTLNEKHIRTIVFNFEKIFSSSFPWNVDHQAVLTQINSICQFVSDVNDAKILNKKVTNKQFLSRDTVLSSSRADKKDNILFIGQINHYYPTRAAILNDISRQTSNLTVIKTDRRYSYDEYLSILNQYKFSLNPLGTGEFINLRYYESIKLGCIPIQQYTENMIEYYPELHHDVLKFKNMDEFTALKLSEAQPLSNYYLEDQFSAIDLNSYL